MPIVKKLEELATQISELEPKLEAELATVSRFEKSLQTANDNKNVVLDELNNVKEQQTFWQTVLERLPELETVEETE